GSVASVVELPPDMLAVIQDPTVNVGRPRIPCFPTVPFQPSNYGTVLAVLFSKPMTQERVNLPDSYRLDNGNTAGSVQIQPGARFALLNMRLPVGALVPRNLTVSNVADPRGNVLAAATRLVQTDLTDGVRIKGLVARADGSPAAGIPVTLTMDDKVSTGLGC